jgi:site-specific DNA recombinase
MTPVCAAIYARVSSDQQAGHATIGSQVAALEARLAQDGTDPTPDGRFVDEGYSGATLVRPALERLRDAVAAGHLDRLYVHSPDRLARRYAYQVLLVDEFRRAGVEIVFLNRSIGVSPEDDLLLQVQGMVAEYERAKILERSRRGKRHAAHQGAVSVLSGAPYGYRYIGKHAGGGVARYEVEEDEARVVQQMFDWVGHERASIGEVCRRLQAQGCPTRSGKPSWDRSTVWGILRNPAYVGAAAFGKTRVGPLPARLRPGRRGAEQPRRAYGVYDVAPDSWVSVPVPPLVEGALAEAAREQLAENRQRSRQHARGQRYLLQGLVVCRHCGYAYYGKAVSLASGKGKTRRYAYYRCTGSDAYRFGGERACANRQVRTDRLDEAVWREVERVLDDPSWVAAEYERRLVQARNPVIGDLAGLESQVAKLRRSLDRLIDGYAEGLIDKAEFEPRAAGLRQRLRGFEEQADRLRDEAAQFAVLSLIVSRLEDFARQIRERMAVVDWSAQRDLIRLLVKRVEIDREEVHVVLRVTPSLTGPGAPNPDGGPVWHHCGRSALPVARQRVPALRLRSVGRPLATTGSHGQRRGRALRRRHRRRVRARGRRRPVPRGADGAARLLLAHAPSGEDAPDPVRPPRGGRAGSVRPRQAGNLRLPRLHLCVRQVTEGQVPAPAADAPRPHGGEAQGREGGVAATEAPADPCPGCVAGPDDERLLQLPRGADQRSCTQRVPRQGGGPLEAFAPAALPARLHHLGADEEARQRLVSTGLEVSAIVGFQNSLTGGFGGDR